MLLDNQIFTIIAMFRVMLQWGRQKIEKHDRRRSTENALKHNQLSNGDACKYCLHSFSVASTAVRCCISFSFQLLSLSDRIVSSQSSLLDRQPMFVLVSLFLVCCPIFLLLLSAEYHDVLTCFPLRGPHNTTSCFVLHYN